MARGMEGDGLHGRRSGGDDANSMYFYFGGEASPCHGQGLCGAGLYD